MSDETVLKQLEEAKKKLEALQSRSAKGILYKVSEKGALSVYGLGRFPVTLYREQWERLLNLSEDIHAFIRENADQLKTKKDKEESKKGA
ncbi:MAG: hypothetical protein RBU30_14685 [Polyangia bacterium]|jgi:hypothetical protein|nr:hypothetical protein [Polyangia bacterium]